MEWNVVDLFDVLNVIYINTIDVSCRLVKMTSLNINNNNNNNNNNTNTHSILFSSIILIK